MTKTKSAPFMKHRVLHVYCTQLSHRSWRYWKQNTKTIKTKKLKAQ